MSLVQGVEEQLQCDEWEDVSIVEPGETRHDEGRGGDERPRWLRMHGGLWDEDGVAPSECSFALAWEYLPPSDSRNARYNETAVS